MPARAATMILPILLLAAAVRADDALDYDHEKFDILGWGDGCSVAITHYGYPPPGQYLEDEPVMSRIGTLSIAPGKTKEKDDWLISLHGPSTWRPKEADKALSLLAQRGYSKPGLIEQIAQSPVVAARDLPRLLNTTEALKASPGNAWLDHSWRWTSIVYEPLGTCALFTYEKRGMEKPFYNYLLVRINNPAARADRAQAHLTNAILLLDKGDLDSAVLESELAARLEPNDALMRYHHAALMALSGVVEPAIDELEAAISLDAQYKAKARKDKDFESLRWHPKFKELTKR